MYLFLGLIFITGLSVMAWIIVAFAKRRSRRSTLMWILALSVEKGLPLHEEVEALAATMRKRRRRRLLLLAELLRDGVPLAEALERVPGLVTPSMVMAARVGSQNGNLPEMLRGEATRQLTGLRQERLGGTSPAIAAFYLIGIPLAAFTVISFVMYYIIPKFKKIFEDFGVELPRTTLLLIDASDFVVTYFYLIPFGLLLMLLAVIAIYRSYTGAARRSPPLTSRFFRRVRVPDILRNLAATVRSGRSTAEALMTMAQTQRDREFRPILARAAEMDEIGTDCWTALHAVGLLRRRELELLHAAWQAGNLDWAAETLAAAMQRRSSDRFFVAYEVAVPDIVLVMGLITGVTVIALFMPVIKMVSDLS